MELILYLLIQFNIRLMEIKREEILLALQSSLLGEVYQSVRAVVFKYDPDLKHFILRYYLDKVPDKNDNESIGNVVAEFISNFKYSDFNKVEEECIYSDKSISELDIMDGIVYCRKEC